MAEKTQLDEMIEFGIDIKNRRIYFGDDKTDDEDMIGGFTWWSIEKAIRAIHKMVADSDKKPIELHVNSAGGSSVDMMRLHDEILTCPCKVIFIGGGMVASSATWIMCACDERYLHKNTRILLHDGFDAGDDRHTDFMINARDTEEWQAFLYELYARNSRMPVEFWADICQRDVPLSAEETIMLGLADKIIEPRKRGNMRRSRIAIMRQIPESKDMRNLVRTIYKRIRRQKIGTINIEIPTEEFEPLPKEHKKEKPDFDPATGIGFMKVDPKELGPEWLPQVVEVSEEPQDSATNTNPKDSERSDSDENAE